MSEGNFVCSPESSVGGYSRITSGDLNGNSSPEVAVIRGTDVIIYHDPDSENASIEVATGAADVCYTPSPTPRLLMITTGGLYSAIFDAEHSEYDVDQVDDDPLWQTASTIHWVTDGIGPYLDDGLIGYATADCFFAAIDTGSGISTPVELFEFGSTVLSFVPVDWTGDGRMEIAILTLTGLQIRSQDGTVLLTRPSAVPGDVITRVARTGWKDSLAWVTRLLNGTSVLVLFNEAFPGNHFQGPLSLGPVTYQSIAAVDLLRPEDSIFSTPDSAEDLVLSTSSSTALRVLYAGPDTGDWFDAEELPREIELGGYPTGRVLCTNLFNDWHGVTPLPGFASVLQAPDGLRLVPEAGSRPDSLVEDYQFVQFWTAGAVDGNCGTDDEADRSKWRIVLGSGWGTTTATEMELVVRKCAGNSNTVDPGVHFSMSFDLEEPGVISGTAIWFTGIEDPGFMEVDEYGTKYFAKIRPRNAITGQTWRWSIVGMSGNCLSFDWLRTRPGASTDLVEMNAWNFCDEQPEDGCPMSLEGSRYIPTAVPQTFIPSAPGTLPGDPPQ